MHYVYVIMAHQIMRNYITYHCTHFSQSLHLKSYTHCFNSSCMHSMHSIQYKPLSLTPLHTTHCILMCTHLWTPSCASLSYSWMDLLSSCHGCSYHANTRSNIMCMCSSQVYTSMYSITCKSTTCCTIPYIICIFDV